MATMWEHALSVPVMIIYVGIISSFLCAIETRRRCEHWLKLQCLMLTGVLFLVVTTCFHGLEEGYADIFFNERSDICLLYQNAASFSLILISFVLLLACLEMRKIRRYSNILLVGMFASASMLFSLIVVYEKCKTELIRINRQKYFEMKIGGAIYSLAWMVCEADSSLQIVDFIAEYIGIYFPLLVLFVIAWWISFRGKNDNNEPLEEIEKLPPCSVDDALPHRCSSCDILDGFPLKVFIFVVIFVIRISFIFLYAYYGTDLQQICVPLTVLIVSTAVSVNVIRGFIMHMMSWT